MSYDLIEHQSFANDQRLRDVALRSGEDPWSASQRRYEVWQREASSGRGETTYLSLLDLDLMSGPAILDWVSTYGMLNIRALDALPADRQ